ncbi:hypothetical protein CRUP_000752 [Coryphaenoides rupestris]|nr:hypothetical protein CRUP_000752 [Coryphaenoides rupestris]
MDALALEAKNVNNPENDKKSAPRARAKPPKKAKRIVYFEVEILDLKTKEKLLLLDKWYPARQSLHLDATWPVCATPSTTSNGFWKPFFVHRISHGTMPLRNIFKVSDNGPDRTRPDRTGPDWTRPDRTNCGYYWCFAAWMAYYINHPLYTPACNFSTHVVLRNVKTPGSKVKKIPFPTKNPFTWIFLLVSCPNYTYELGTWLGFTVMTQCVPVAFFTVVGFIQMTIWAKGKHRGYVKEFKDYPTLRSSILPFVL